MNNFAKSRSWMLVGLLGVAAVAPLTANASPACTKEPKSAWLPEAKMKEKIATMGYREIRIFKTSGSCYEIYAIDAKGRKAEVYFNPVDGAVVKSNED